MYRHRLSGMPSDTENGGFFSAPQKRRFFFRLFSHRRFDMLRYAEPRPFSAYTPEFGAVKGKNKQMIKPSLWSLLIRAEGV
jgi:hypothetical protein